MNHFDFKKVLPNEKARKTNNLIVDEIDDVGCRGNTIDANNFFVARVIIKKIVEYVWILIGLRSLIGFWRFLKNFKRDYLNIFLKLNVPHFV